MTVVDRLKYLRVILFLAGLAWLALYLLMLIWPSGWAWHVHDSDYSMMIVGIYATFGVFLILAARERSSIRLRGAGTIYSYKGSYMLNGLGQMEAVP